MLQSEETDPNKLHDLKVAFETQCKVIFPDGRVVVDNLTTRPWTLADIRRAALGSGLVEQESLGRVGYEDLMRFCKP